MHVPDGGALRDLLIFRDQLKGRFSVFLFSFWFKFYFWVTETSFEKKMEEEKLLSCYEQLLVDEKTR